MKTKKICTLLAMSILLFSSCSPKDGDRHYFSKSFINAMIVPKKMDLSIYEKYDNIIRVSFNKNSKEIITAGDQVFDNLCKRYGDESYNGYLMHWQHSAYAPEFTAINVTCDRDFDALHPVGTSLNGLFRLHGFSAYDFIKNEYKMRAKEDYLPSGFNYTALGSGYSEYQPITMMLNELKLDDLKLLSVIAIELVEKPAPGDYNLTVSFTNENGTLSGNITMTIE